MSLLRCPRADAVGWAAPEAEDNNNRKVHKRPRQIKRKIEDDESNNLAADHPTSNYTVSDADVGAPNTILTAPQDVTSARTTTGTLSTKTMGIAGSAADSVAVTAEGHDRTDTADSNPVNDDGSTIVTFDPRGSEIVITGTATVTVLDGRVEIMGCLIGSTDEIPYVQVCSPDGSWSSSLTILDVSATKRKDQEENEFSGSGNTITRIKISPLPWDGSEASSTCTFHVASRSDVRFAITVADRWKAAATAVLSDMHTRKPPNASDLAEYAPDPERVVVCGAKSVGKSTYVRYLVNKIMTSCTDRNGKRKRVAILDCDVGQPELGPPGLITLTILERPLLSPPHTHMICKGQAQDSACPHGKETNFEAAPGHASTRFFGHVSAKADPSSYVAAIASLLSQYETLVKKQYQDERNQHDAFPLVVNTSGWVKGMGFEILSSIVDAVKPGHIIQIVGAARSKFFDLTPHAFEGRSIHVVEAFGSMSRLPTEQDITQPQSRSVSPAPPSITAGVDRAAESAVLTKQKPNAADTPTTGSTVPATSTLRSLRFASYFLGGYKHLLASGAKFWPSAGGIFDAHCNVASKLAAMKPYVVPFRSVYCSVPTLAEYQGRVEANDLILKSLNGAIVGLCHWSADPEKQVLGALDGCSVHAAPLNLNTALLPCVGLGLIRGVDRSRQCFYVLTPIAPEQLRNRAPNVLVRAGIQVPIECIFSGVHSEAFPYQSSDGLVSGIGDDMMKSRNAPIKK